MTEGSMARSYYAILGIPPRASQEDVKAAYRRLAKEYHPDHYAGAGRPFLDLQEAYSVLSDAARRRKYDAALSRARSGATPEPERGLRRDRCPCAAGPRRMRAGLDAVDPEPLIPRTGPGGGPFRFRPASRRPAHTAQATPADRTFSWLRGGFLEPRRGPEDYGGGFAADVLLSPEECRRGGRVRIPVPARVACPACGGRGAIGLFACRRCAGAGRVVREVAVPVSYPAGITEDRAFTLRLAPYGLTGLELDVVFRPRGR